MNLFIGMGFSRGGGRSKWVGETKNVSLNDKFNKADVLKKVIFLIFLHLSLRKTIKLGKYAENNIIFGFYTLKNI